MSAARRPVICVVLDVASLGVEPELRARALFSAGADWIQLRDRAIDSRALLLTAQALVRARDRGLQDRPCETGTDVSGASPYPVRVILNRRADVARAAGADGVHLGFDALAPARAREILAPAGTPPGSIGRSLHSPDEVARTAAGGGVDYVHLAPIWDPVSKAATRPALGIEQLSRACGHGVPVLAQGGLDARRAAEAWQAGAAGIALTGAVAGPEGGLEALDSIRQALDEAASMS